MGIFPLFMRDGQFDISGYLSFLLVAFFAFAYHEFAHALAADRLGDDTPRLAGRMTLNPFPHIDRLGFILLALLGFGWATTPVNPSRLKGNPRQSYALVAAAGPLANLLMAGLFALLVRMSVNFPGAVPGWIPQLFWIGVWLNCFLFAFNLLPVPPLDGFSILLGILPSEMAYRLAPLRQHGFIIFMVIFFLLPMINIQVFGTIFQQAFRLAGLMAGISPF